VRWYLRYKLSYRDLVEMMAERGLPVAHTTILRWVRRYAQDFDKSWSRFAVPAGTSWRVDETYVRIRGRWAYLYRAVDASGKTVDFRLSPQRNVASVKAFFRKAVRSQRRSPETITLDAYAASHWAVGERQEQGRLPELTKLRSSKYLNNLIEQDHRNVKCRLGTMLDLKSFASPAITSRGVELMHRIRKEQFDLRAVAAQGQTTPEIWAPVLAA
jgi:transposase-like protein